MRGGQGGFAVVNVTDGADVDVRFRSLKLFFCHCYLLVFVVCFIRYCSTLKYLEPMIRIELMTSSLPRTCSTN